MLKPTYVIAACSGICIALGIGVLINQALIQV